MWSLPLVNPASAGSFKHACYYRCLIRQQQTGCAHPEEQSWRLALGPPLERGPVPSRALAFLASLAPPLGAVVSVCLELTREEQGVIVTVESTAEGSQSFYSDSWKTLP